MSFFGDIKDKFSKDTYEGGYMYEDDGANGQYGYDETPETPDMPADNEATIGGSGYDIMGGGSSIELKVVKVNVDEAPELAAQFGIMSIPALFCYRDGAKVAEFIGVTDAATIRSALG